MTAPAWSPGAMVERSPAYRAGWDFTEAELADESQAVREAAARHMADAQADMPVNTQGFLALAGGLAYLTQRHENNQPKGKR